VKNFGTAAPQTPLSAREREVLVLLGKGCTNREIGRHLEISAFTVSEHVRKILRRLDVSGRVEAAVWAAKEGLL